MIPLHLTPKEVHILVQALRIVTEAGTIEEYARSGELNILRDKLQNAKG